MQIERLPHPDHHISPFRMGRGTKWFHILKVRKVTGAAVLFYSLFPKLHKLIYGILKGKNTHI